MLTLEEILQRFTTRRIAELPTQTFEPVQADATGPVVVNGMAEIFHYIAEQNQRINELEKQLESARKTS